MGSSLHVVSAIRSLTIHRQALCASWRIGWKHDRDADEVAGAGTGSAAACGYMGRLSACNRFCGGFAVRGQYCWTHTTRAVETTRLETRATEFVLFASVLHCSEGRAAKAFSRTIPFPILTEGRA
jgi:hypothetical protein